MKLEKGTSDTHFWADGILFDVLLLEKEVSRTANGRIIHDINLALSELKRVARLLYLGKQEEAERENTKWALGFLYRWGVPGIPRELTNVLKEESFGSYLRQNANTQT